MLRYRKILTGVDGSTASLHALKEAIRLAQWAKGGVTAVAVTPPFEGDLGLVGVKHPKTLMDGPCEDILQKARHTAQSCEARIGVTCASGEPYRELEHLAEETGCDLIVLGIEGRSSFLRSLTGSTIGHAIRSGERDVLCVPQGISLQWERILCLLDSAIDSRRLSHRAIELAASYGGRVWMAASQAVLGETASDGLEKGQTAANFLREEIDVLARKAAVPCEVLKLEGQGVRRILDLIRHNAVTMLLIERTRRQWAHEAILASYAAEKMIRRAPCPTLIVHTAPEIQSDQSTR